jgi:hypothetical protein
VQTDPDAREIDAGVDGDGSLRGLLMNVVNGAQRKVHSQQIVHEFDDAAKRRVTDMCQRDPDRREPQRCHATAASG